MSGKHATFSVRPFEKLRKSIEQRESSAEPAAPRQKKKEEYTDEELFGQEMRGVSEYPEFRSLACLRRPREKTAAPARSGPDEEALMKIIALVSITLLAALGVGCATRNVYDGLRFRQEMDCRQVSGMDRDECQRRSGMSYDEYERRLKERDQQK